MKISSKELLDDLIQRTNQVITATKKFQEMEKEQLNWKSNAESWSILECLEHLNLYGDFYLPEIESKMNNAKTVQENEVFKSGWLGNYFAKSMLPKNGTIKKMKTFKDKNPSNSQLPSNVIERFLDQQTTTLAILEKAKKVNLNKVKTGVSIANFIKLKLGDTFRVVIYHNERHILQAQNVVAAMKEKVEM